MKENELSFESSSFRDNFGNVFEHQGRILRSVKEVASENYEFLKRRFNIFRRLKKDQLAIDDLSGLIKLRPEVIDNYRLLADYCITFHQYSKAFWLHKV